VFQYTLPPADDDTVFACALAAKAKRVVTALSPRPSGERPTRRVRPRFLIGSAAKAQSAQSI
jgi:hypothetical protein